MITIDELYWEEKVFFAGCLKAMILIDCVIDDEEIAGVDAIRDEDRFDDLDEALESYEEEARDSGDDDVLWRKAAGVARPEAREFILSRLRYIALRDGYAKDAEERFLGRLREIWGVEL